MYCNVCAFALTVHSFASVVIRSPFPLVCRQNNLHELWALLNFLLPSVFKDSEAFSKVFDLNVDDADKKQNMIKQLHKILRYSSSTCTPDLSDTRTRGVVMVLVLLGVSMHPLSGFEVCAAVRQRPRAPTRWFCVCS